MRAELRHVLDEIDRLTTRKEQPERQLPSCEPEKGVNVKRIRVSTSL